MPFELLSPTAVKLMHVNLRPEKHGDEDVPAIDLKFCLAASNAALDMFHPKLRDALYYNAEAEQGQEQIDGVPEVLPNRRFTAMEPIDWDLELPNRIVVVDWGLGDDSNIKLHDCRVNRFKISPIEGGTVEIEFRVQTSQIPEGALDKLSKKLKQETAISILPPTEKPDAIDGTTGHPALAGQGDILDDAPWPFGDKGEDNAPATAKVTKGKRGKKAQDATEVFVAAHGEAEAE